MKYIVFLIVFLPFACLGQYLDATLIKKPNMKGNVYFLKIYNKSTKPIAIKCSMSFLRFSEQDTLQLIKTVQYDGSAQQYIYRLDHSEEDSRSSEPNPFQLIIINPQTYLLCNIELTDLSSRDLEMARFAIPYLKDVSDNDYKEYTDRSSIRLTIVSRLFIFETIKLSAIENK